MGKEIDLSGFIKISRQRGEMMLQDYIYIQHLNLLNWFCLKSTGGTHHISLSPGKFDAEQVVIFRLSFLSYFNISKAKELYLSLHDFDSLIILFRMYN